MISGPKLKTIFFKIVGIYACIRSGFYFVVYMAICNLRERQSINDDDNNNGSHNNSNNWLHYRDGLKFETTY